MDFHCQKIYNHSMPYLSFIFKQLISLTQQLQPVSPSPALNKTLQNYFEKPVVFFTIS